MEKVTLRTYIFLDSMQPQFASFVASAAKGFQPLPGMAACYVEVAPGMAINEVMDVALKATEVKPAMMIVERAYGLLEVHSFSQANVREAGKAILDFLGLKDRYLEKDLEDAILRELEAFLLELGAGFSFTELPSKKLLKQKLHAAIRAARIRLSQKQLKGGAGVFPLDSKDL